MEHAAARAALRDWARTALGLAFALVATRSNFRYKKLLRALSILPIITPPFVIGLGLILLFGRSGIDQPVSRMGLRRSSRRAGSTGLPGLLLAQIFCRSRRSRSWS